MRKGSVVRSKSGHDKGRLYVIVKITDGFAGLSDGKRKTLDKPKRKNLRHIEDTGLYIDFSKYDCVCDAHIRKELRSVK